MSLFYLRKIMLNLFNMNRRSVLWYIWKMTKREILISVSSLFIELVFAFLWYTTLTLKVSPRP